MTETQLHIWNMTEATPVDKLILLCIRDNAIDDPISDGVIARMTGLARETVWQSASRLKRQKLIVGHGPTERSFMLA
jgi:hypothetical protein